MHSKLELEGFSEHVGARMPESLSSSVVTELEKLDLAVTLQRARCVIIHPAFAFFTFFLLRVLEALIEGSDTALRVTNLGDDDLLGELARDHFGDVDGARLKGSSLLGISVGKSDRDGLLGHGGQLFSLLGEESVPVGISLVDEGGPLLELPVSAKDLDFFISDLVAGGQLGSLSLFAGVRVRSL